MNVSLKKDLDGAKHLKVGCTDRKTARYRKGFEITFEGCLKVCNEIEHLSEYIAAYF